MVGLQTKLNEEIMNIEIYTNRKLVNNNKEIQQNDKIFEDNNKNKRKIVNSSKITIYTIKKPKIDDIDTNMVKILREINNSIENINNCTVWENVNLHVYRTNWMRIEFKKGNIVINGRFLNTLMPENEVNCDIIDNIVIYVIFR